MIIYKYFSREGALAALNNKSVLLKCPTEYNDPFDCIFYVNQKEKDKAYKLFINYIFFSELYNAIFVQKKLLSSLSPGTAKILETTIAQIADMTKESKRYVFQPGMDMWLRLIAKQKDLKLEEAEQACNKKIDEMVLQIREMAVVSCFSLDYKSILMWSHYGEDHKGACFEYEVNDEKIFQAVKYKNSLPLFRLTRLIEYYLGHVFAGKAMEKFNDDFYEFALVPLFTKSKDWKYEKEVRCVFSADDVNENIWHDEKGRKLYKMPKPRRILLGCKSTKAFETKIKTVCGDIPFEKLEMEEGKYSIK